MTGFAPRNERFREAVRESFARQAFMTTLGATLVLVEPGAADIELTHAAPLTQQNGFLHAGVLTSIADSACGYAAYSLCPEGTDVLSVEFKINLLAPARAPRVLASARVLRAGRTLTACEAKVWGIPEDGERTLLATMLATIIARASPEAGRTSSS